MDNKRLGDLGERLAARFLLRLGYRILTKGYRYRHGEIDIVAQEKGMLVFVEVRCGCGCEFGLPEESIDFTKRRHIIKAALDFQGRFGVTDYNSRFDCVSIIFDARGNVLRMRLFKDAFWS